MEVKWAALLFHIFPRPSVPIRKIDVAFNLLLTTVSSRLCEQWAGAFGLLWRRRQCGPTALHCS